VKSKKWLISLGLAVILVVSFAIPACTGEPTEYLHSPYTDEKIELTLTVANMPADWVSMGGMIVDQLQDFGIDASLTTMEHATYTSKMYDPIEGGLQMWIYSYGPGYDPYGDWIWSSLSDWFYMGMYWNGTYWYNATYDELYWQNYHTSNLEEKQAILYEMQEILNEELPKYLLLRGDIIAAYRTDRWTNWHMSIGGVANWLNVWSVLDAEAVDGATRMDIGFPSDMPNLFMDNDVIDQTTLGCFYKVVLYECLAILTKIEVGHEEDAYLFTPRLAANYSVSTENRTHPVYNTTWEAQVWTIELQEDAKWHDGVNFTAYDVEYTAKNVWTPWDPDKPVTWQAYEESWDMNDLVWWVEVVNDHTIEFIYEDAINPNYPPPWWHWQIIAPKHIFEPDEREPSEWDGNSIGTGPFKFVEHVPGEYQHWTRNDDWWGDDLPEVQDLYCRTYPSTSAEMLALQAGDIDAFAEHGLPPALIEEMEANPDITVEIMRGSGIVDLGFNFYSDGYRDEEGGGPYLEPEVNPLQDKVLRQAIAYAIDMEAIIDLVYQGYGTLTDSYIYDESPNYNPDLEMYEFDTTTARNILEAAGYYWA